jgi:hypothetical protein
MKSSFRDPETTPGVLEACGDLVAVGLGLLTLPARDALDLLPVLVEPRQEEGLVPARAVVAGQRVRDDGRVERAQVGEGVDVIDRCRDVEAGHR